MAIHKMGPGTLTMDPGGSAVNFECQVKSFEVTTEYEEISEEVKYLGDGCTDGAVEEMAEGITFEIDHDLTATGLYSWSRDNNLSQVPFEFVPNTAQGVVTPAMWSGTVIVKVPNVAADEYGARLTGSVEWSGVGAFTFTPAADV